MIHVLYSLFAVGMVAAGAGGKSRSKFGTTSALLSISRQTPSIAPTTVAVAKASAAWWMMCSSR